MVNQILNKGLHTSDDESMAYTTNLMDKLEQTKSTFPEEAAIHDDMAAKAYVEQFGLDTFQRADNAVRANKVSAFVNMRSCIATHVLTKLADKRPILLEHLRHSLIS